MQEDKNGHESRRHVISEQDRETFKSRASELGRKLDDVAKRRTPATDNNAGERGAAMGQAFKIAAELVAGVGFGAVVGWSLDRYFETSGPWFMMVFLILGFAAGMLNVIRTATRMQAKSESLQRSSPSLKDDDEKDR
jgi:ATP synthase protein I